jgi:hypothetical protein
MTAVLKKPTERKAHKPISNPYHMDPFSKTRTSTDLSSVLSLTRIDTLHQKKNEARTMPTPPVKQPQENQDSSRDATNRTVEVQDNDYPDRHGCLNIDEGPKTIDDSYENSCSSED